MDDRILPSTLPVDGRDTTTICPGQLGSTTVEPCLQTETDSHQSRGGLYEGWEDSMLASGDDVGPAPDPSDWWPTFPISNYLADKIAHPQPDDSLATNLGAQCGMVASPTSTISKIQPSAVDSSGYGISQPFQEVLGTTRASSALVHDTTPNRPARRKMVCERGGCSASFPTKKDLRRHIVTVHDQVKVQCPRCLKSLRGRDDNLKRHMGRYCKGTT